ncbi:hypothetical protein K466DRAFT_498943 [Polyporus arcularius HHB13444]|uniref:Protein BIG1 n=1 Tax=Polyporus arcularius HHB13444 TaxID=1314778 RepID=A0A5C3PBI2_9APHY|nr:hypothetical protein K466DRAFT_498943 [Polyporus arcularius HHB13444]
MASRAFTFLLALLPAVASAYPNTHPVLAWSSRSSKALSSVAASDAAKTGSHAIAEALYNHNDICEHDAVIVVEHAGLHASDLRSLSPSCHTSKALSGAPSKLQLAYVESDSRFANPFVDLAGVLSRRCGSRAVSHSPSFDELALDADQGKHVVSISLPPLEDGETGSSRKSAMASHESWLSSELAKIEEVFSNCLVIYSGSPGVSLHARQSSSSSTFDSVQADASPKGGILKRYQLLTPGLILVLLVVLFILIPIIFVGVSALSSIQSPLSNEIPKGFSAEEKKTQ